MKMNMSRLLTLMLALVMVLSCFALVGCGNDASDPAKDSGKTPGSTDSDTDRGEDYLLSIPKHFYE